MSKPILIAATSDQHVGSTVGLCPPDPVPLDDGGEYRPSKVQKWLWSCWSDYWQRVEEVRDREGAELYVIFNGDMVDGDHHNTPQIVSRNPTIQFGIAERVFSVPLSLDPAYVFVVRGTESHVGTGGSSEESLARMLGATPDKDRGTSSWWHLRMKLQGRLIDFAHHGRTGYRPWTRANATNLLAAQIVMEHVNGGEQWPDLAIRSHFHRFGDSYDHQATRVIQLGAWQVATAYVHKVAPESLADIGGALVLLRDGEIDVEKWQKSPDRGRVWQP